jgi:TonB-dependent receptor-like protein
MARCLALLLCCAALCAAEQRRFGGLRLDDALRLLQHAGLPILFSSEVVKPSMRVRVEPRSTTPRQQLDELLAPHGLKAEDGPRRLILVVRDGPPAARDLPQRARSGARTGGAEPHRSSAPQDRTKYSDSVTVWGSGQQRMDRGGSATTLGSSAVRLASSVLAGDGLEAAQTMPGVIAGDDLRSEFSVRGSPYRHIGIVIDGVATPWLQHTVYGRNDAGSLSMFASDIVDRVTLQAGAYPRRYDSLGAQLEVTLKEGSRESTRFNVRAGGTSAAVVGQGPIGKDGRGSWIAGVRNSYRSWPPQRLSQNDVGFAFADVHAKLVYDVSPTQQVSVTTLGGRSALETADEPLVGPLGNGTDRAALLTIGWRSTLGSRSVVRQRVSFIGQELMSTLASGQLAGRSNNRALGYRGEALHSIAGGLMEAGAELSSMAGARDIAGVGPAALRDAFRATWTTHAADVNFGRAAPGGLSFEGGVRVSDSTLVRERAVAPWIRAAWRFRPAWTVNASTGASRQFPAPDAILGLAGSSDLVPERATHVDVGIEQRRSRVLWNATLFNRLENEVLRPPDLQPRLMQGAVLDPPGPGRYRNWLSGASRGIELVVTPVGTARLSGWMSYTYAIARQTDISTRETFWSDVDRRQAFNAAGALRIGHQATMGLVLRAASGVPIRGYFDVRDGTLFVGDHRNDVRLSPYVRVDARVQRMFFSSRHAVTVFAEVLNALNRHNEGLAEGVVEPVTGEAVGFSRRLVPRRVSIGIEVSLRR